MKNQLTLSLIALLFTFSAFAQNFEAPKKGAKIYIENTTVELSEKEEVSFDLYLVKSRVARKANFEDPRLIGPKGIDFTVSKDTTDPSHYVVSVKANEITTGDYSVTVTGKRSGIHAVTGAILFLKVNPAESVASKDGE